MNSGSEEDESGRRRQHSAPVARGTGKRRFALIWQACLSAVLCSVAAVRADETNAAPTSCGQVVFTNAAELAAAVDQPGTPVLLWVPGMFEGGIAFAAWDQLPGEISAIRGSGDYEFSGIRFTAVTLVQDAATGVITVKYPFSDTVLYQFDPPPDFQPFQRYNQELERFCLDNGMSPMGYSELIQNDRYGFLEPPQLVLNLWVGEASDCATYEANVAADLAAAEQEALSTTSLQQTMAIRFAAMDEEGGGDGFAEGFAPGPITSLTQPFRIISIRREINDGTKIIWESSPVFRYIVLYANELSPTTTWWTAAYVWGQANLTNLTTWTDTTTANVMARFYKVQRILGNPIAAGASHSLAALTNGLVFAWGYNDQGQVGLGIGSPVINPFPAEVFGSVCTSFISNAVAVAGGGDQPPRFGSEKGYSVAVDSKGVVWTWGYNFDGQLGNGSEGTGFNKDAPSPITGVSNVVSVAAGMAHTLALRADGAVWGWGHNGFGQLGTGGSTFDHTDSPVQSTVPTQIVAIAAGGDHSVALDQNGNVWTWGNNDLGQLGLGPGVPLTFTNVPALVTTISNVIAIAGGFKHTIALTSDKRVWTWGDNYNGQLGLGSDTPVYANVPTLVPAISGVVAIAGGDAFSLAATTNGFVYGWGNNWNGQLGVYTGMVAKTNSPIAVAGITNAVLVSAPPQQTGSHSLAVTIEQGVNRYWGWGSSYYGQVGNGLTNQSFSYPCGDFDTCTSNNDSNVYAPAGPLEFQYGCNQDIQLGTSGSFTAQCMGTLYLFLNDYHREFGDNWTNSWNSFSVTIDHGLGTTNVLAAAENGVAIGTVTNGLTYTYSATGWCYHCEDIGGNPDCPSDPDGKDIAGNKWNCSGRSPCTLICPQYQCFSLVGRIR